MSDTDVKIQNDGAVKAPNPLLERLNKLPGTTVQLPSGGIFYTDGELDSECQNGEVVVFPMTTTDEIMMRSPDMLFQGTAIENVVKRCIPQIKKPLDLLVGDVDYILTNLRKISYGPQLPVRYDCDCFKNDPEKYEKVRAEASNEYLIPIDTLIQKTTPLDAKSFNKDYKVTLQNGQVVVLQPLRFGDYIKLQQSANKSDDMNSIEEIKDYVASNFAAVTKSVDGIEDRELIKEWYRDLYRSETALIKNKIDEFTPWGIDFKYEITCRLCKNKKGLVTQLNPVYFFMLPSSPERKKSSKAT